MLDCLHDQFKKAPDHRNPLMIEIPMQDMLMSAFAVFSLKLASLLKLDRLRKDGAEKLIGLYRIGRVPSDTQMRSVLDEVGHWHLRNCFKKLFSKFQRANLLKQFEFYNRHYLLSVDGSGYFYSDEVHCESCLTKKDRNGKVSYYHQMLAASIVHPEKATVIPFCPEPIQRQPGETQNDSERSAMDRFVNDFRREHPYLKVILVADALHATSPFVRLLKLNKMSFILSVKPGSHEKLFEGLNKFENLNSSEIFFKEEEIGEKIKKKRIHEFRFKNRVLLNHADLSFGVNFLEYWETTQWVDGKGRLKEKKVHFSWVTDQELTRDNVMQIMRGGRARWKIENETFNTLKNQGYEFEHNFGHGYKHLTNVFAFMMMLAFMFDQLQEIGCKVFQKALKENHSCRSYLWEALQSLYRWAPELQSWSQFIEYVAYKEKWIAKFNTS